ncbi:hypothetical protein CY34DRAFT_802889 [Suillus luteus UH-Slu-Lm8-n1]|uniref:F-box domain-containing protein n=1 Tax=Suillus luteus UH-Slu-Lm8-n1 TaxID=930992 RepID=A0A0D0ARA3_9AGAM|nr:hypothetical protein CY34DRAFT_802889 [Suillus luteus UH-Slu-Lm8-n1]
MARSAAAKQESKRVLRSRRNELLPIFRLPTEILVMVFKNVEEDHRLDESAHSDVPACVVVSRVCKYWRSVAYACPALWTHIRSTNPHLVAIMLEKSRNFPLVVMYKTPAPPRHCLKPILSHLPRIESLKFRALEIHANDIIQWLSSQPAPLLETFEFSTPIVTQNSADVDITPISSVIFQGQAPRLRSVHLTVVPIDWTADIFSGIRSLSIMEPGPEYLTLSQFLSALTRMPALEHLSLERILFLDEGTMPYSTVSLPQLKSMALGNPTLPEAITVFRQLVLPADVKISLCLDSLRDIYDLFEVMPGGFRSIIKSMRAICFNGYCLCVQFSTSPTMNPADFWNASDDDIRLSLHIVFKDDDGMPMAIPELSIVFDICQAAMQDMDGIQSLYLVGFGSPNREFWRAGSACLPNVEAIHLEGIWLEGIIAALGIVNDDEHDIDILYPSLRVLELKATLFDYETLLNSLQAIWHMRANHGVGIDTLRLTECRRLLNYWVRRFREVIETVDWDECHWQEHKEDSDERLAEILETGRPLWYDDAANDRNKGWPES